MKRKTATNQPRRGKPHNPAQVPHSAPNVEKIEAQLMERIGQVLTLRDCLRQLYPLVVQGEALASVSPETAELLRLTYLSGTNALRNFLEQQRTLISTLPEWKSILVNRSEVLVTLDDTIASIDAHLMTFDLG